MVDDVALSLPFQSPAFPSISSLSCCGAGEESLWADGR